MGTISRVIFRDWPGDLSRNAFLDHWRVELLGHVDECAQVQRHPLMGQLGQVQTGLAGLRLQETTHVAVELNDVQVAVDDNSCRRVLR